MYFYKDINIVLSIVTSANSIHSAIIISIGTTIQEYH